jgi:hypothetical protein
MVIERGEIWWATLPEPTASEPGYRRPVLADKSFLTEFVGSLSAKKLRQVEERFLKVPLSSFTPLSSHAVVQTAHVPLPLILLASGH